MPSKKSLAGIVMQTQLGNPADPLKISFLPEMVSPQNLRTLMRVGKLGKNATEDSVNSGLDGIVRLLKDVLVEWNLTEDDEPNSPIVPLTFEGISSVGFKLLQDISEAIFNKVSVPEQSGTISSEPTNTPSYRKARSTTSQIRSSRTKSKSLR
jgi:hypothetical protein